MDNAQNCDSYINIRTMVTNLWMLQLGMFLSFQDLWSVQVVF
jgi:hypothetical protein